MKRTVFLLTLFTSCTLIVAAQNVGSTPEYIKAITSEWKGERFPDGRPKVSDNLLERVKNLGLEDAWGVLRNKGYHNQYEGDWHVIHPEAKMTGRVVTAQYMPLRPDLEKYIREQGARENRAPQGGTNSWPIDQLVEGDIYVADAYGKIIDGTLIGDNLGNSIYSKSKRGVIFYGAVRDEEGLSEIDGFNAWVKGSDPSYIMQMSLTSINTPIRVGRAVVLPGDIALANKYGVLFIPAHLTEEVVISSEFTTLRDEFGHLRLREGKYKPGEIDSRWSDAIKQDFLNWINNYPGKLPMTKQELDNYMKDRNW
jgi:regulator of RNase E activity RraA